MTLDFKKAVRRMHFTRSVSSAVHWISPLLTGSCRSLALLLLWIGALSNARAGDFPGVLHSWGDSSGMRTTPPAGLGKVLAISASRAHSLAIKADGGVVTWGTEAPPVPNSLPKISQVAAGFYHSVALGTNGLVYSWGGETALKTPDGLNSVVAIAAGEQHTMALRANGTVIVWGLNNSGQLNVPNGLGGVKAIAAGDNHCLALLSNGRVVGWGDDRFGQAPSQLAINATAIAAGTSHSLALLSDGRLQIWGDQNMGQAAVPANLGKVTQIAAGGNCTLVITANRLVRAWGEPESPLLDVPQTLVNAFRLSAGLGHALAIQVDPPVIQTQPVGGDLLIGSPITFSVGVTGSDPLTYQWLHAGTNLPTATTPTLTLNSVQSSDEGLYSVSIANGAGSVQSGNALLTVRIPPTISVQPVDATVGQGKSVSFKVVATGPNLTFRWRLANSPLPFGVFSTYNIASAQLADIGGYSVVVSNSFGVITSRVATLLVKPLPTIVSQPVSKEVFPGVATSFSVSALNGESYQWFKNGQPLEGETTPNLQINPVGAQHQGSYHVRVSNTWGEINSDPATLTVTPVSGYSELFGWGETEVWNGSAFVNVLPPAGLAGIQLFTAGQRHGLAYRTTGTLIGWGDNSNGEITIPGDLGPLLGIAAGDGFSVALRTDGTVRAWGRTDGARTSVPANLSQVISIAAGYSHTLALRADGSVNGWGTTTDGESAVPGNLGKAKAIAAGLSYNLVLLQNGTVTGWGRNDFGQRRPPTGLSNVVAVAAGQAHSVALLGDGTLRAWGDNSFGQTSIPSLSAKAIAIAAGADHSIALLANNQVVVWGSNNSGQREPPREAQPAIGISAFGDHCVVNRRRGLRFSNVRLTNGRFGLTLSSADGAAIDATRAAKIKLYISEDAGLPLDQWSLGGTLSLSNGELRILELLNTSRTARFYRAVEQP